MQAVFWFCCNIFYPGDQSGRGFFAWRQSLRPIERTLPDFAVAGRCGATELVFGAMAKNFRAQPAMPVRVRRENCEPVLFVLPADQPEFARNCIVCIWPGKLPAGVFARQ